LFTRGSKRDYDDWARYLGDEGWAWDNFISSFKKSETFTPPIESYRVQGNITWDISVHGQTGPISITYPPQFFPSVMHLVAAEKALGIPLKTEFANGDPVGAIWYPIAIRAGEYTRSYSKREYYDPVKSRGNLHYLPDNTVTRILFNGKDVIGVEVSDYFIS
jgi:choline dehydrogenase